MKVSASPSLTKHPRLGQWVSIAPQAVIVVRSGKVELGQGIGTAIRQIAADALGVSLDRVKLVAGDTAESPDESYTAGSLSVEVGGSAVEAACACLRAHVARLAADRLGLDPDTLTVEDGTFAGPDGRGLSYWQLAEAIDPDLAIDPEPAIDPDLAIDPHPVNGPESGSRRGRKPALVGRSVPRTDLVAKLTGAAFIHDISLPGMVHGRVLRPSHPGARLRAFDAVTVRALPGVVSVVVDGSFIGLAALREEQAVDALRRAAKIAQWEPRSSLPEIPDCADVAQWLVEQAHRTIPVLRQGYVTGAQAGEREFDAAYSRPFLAHASIGPCCALAAFDAGHLQVWSHTQGVFQLRGQLARALSLAQTSIRVVHCDGAGCYGHNGADDVALDAAIVAIACGRPVLMQWTRSDEFSCAPMGSAMHVRLQATVAADGRIRDWKHVVTSQTHSRRPGFGEGVNLLAASEREQVMPAAAEDDLPLAAGAGGARNAVALYQFDRQHVDLHLVTGTGLRSSAMRSLGAFANVFAIESFLDEIALEMGVDPIALRLRHLGDARARDVLSTLARLVRWVPGEAGNGQQGRGFGFAQYKNRAAYCAVLVEVDVTDVLRVRSARAVVDCGRVVNPDGARNQIEGGIVQAISWTLKEAVHWQRNGFLTRSWADYPILRFDETPEIEVELIDRPELPSVGVGECAAGPAAAAVANALHRAIGVRARHLPLTPERIARAMDDRPAAIT